MRQANPTRRFLNWRAFLCAFATLREQSIVVSRKSATAQRKTIRLLVNEPFAAIVKVNRKLWGSSDGNLSLIKRR